MTPLAVILLGIGMVLTVEGLVLALAPSRIEQMLELLRAMSPDIRRGLGLGALALGIAIIWLAQRLMG